jgi:hypothetical protein
MNNVKRLAAVIVLLAAFAWPASTARAEFCEEQGSSGTMGSVTGTLLYEQNRYITEGAAYRVAAANDTYSLFEFGPFFSAEAASADVRAKLSPWEGRQVRVTGCITETLDNEYAYNPAFIGVVTHIEVAA